uniref:Flavanone 4-reductase n=1 Tax=Dryopteris erythrosora TaxID=239562 RepID=A0A5P8I1X0_9MONI|nr:dihydroflavonol 4-reductase [Dryopteris erythrosora]
MDKPLHSTVLVTGCTGHIGSWLVLRLLEKGYSVRAAVLDPEDKQDVQPLLGLAPSLAERLEIVKADLRVKGDFDKVAQGCDGVFHLACPTNFLVEDPQKDVIEPAVQGTLNVLNACVKSSSVKRVIHVSSAAAIRFSGKEVAEQVFDESCWTDVDFCIDNKIPGWPYFVGKTLGEKAAVEFAKEHNLDLVVVNPSIVHGPFLLSNIPNSVKDCLALITGELFKLPFLARMSYIHTDDLVRAFIFLYENPEASGRYICSAVDASITEVVNIISSRYPEFKIPTDLAYLGEPVIHYFDSSKLKRLGFQFNFTLEDMYHDAIKCCKEKGLL